MRRSVGFFAFALFLCTQSAAVAQCTAFLIPPKALVFDDDGGKSPWTLVERKETIQAVPAQRATFSPSGPQVKIDEGAPHAFIAPTWAACSNSDFKTNKRTGLTRLWVINEHGKGFREVWAKIDDLIAFQYDAPLFSSSSAAETMGKIIHAAGLKRDALANADFKPPEVEAQRVFSGDFDRVWSALIETLSDAKWQVESIDKSSGLITTKPAVGGRRDVVCGTAYDKDHKTWLNIFVKKSDTGTRVKINATFHAIKEDEVITCYSNGTTEAEIFKGIEDNSK